MPTRPVTTDAPVHERKAALFKALGHPVRVRLLELVVAGETPVAALIAATGLEASHLSQHLAVLRRTGLVAARREGNTVHYRAAHDSVADLLTAARAVLLESLTETHDALTDLAAALEPDR